MFLRCLRCSSLRLLAGASCLCLWFEDGCCCAVRAAARYVCWQELRTFGRWILLRCLRCSSLRLLPGPSYLCLWFDAGCCFAVCAAARYVCWQELCTFASGLKMDVTALSALQLPTFVDTNFVSLPLVMI